MLTISDVMEMLEQEDRDRLMLCFEAGKNCHIIYKDKKVIGVNIPPDNVTVEKQYGFWYLGDIS
jgi:hypothetical protein